MALSVNEALQYLPGAWFRWNSRIIYVFGSAENELAVGTLTILAPGSSLTQEYEYELRAADFALKLRIEEKWYTIITLNSSKQTLKIVDDSSGKELIFTSVHAHVL